MVQLICTMIQLANVSQTVGCQLARAEVLVVLATIHHRVYGKDEILSQGVVTVAVPFIQTCTMIHARITVQVCMFVYMEVYM